ncbi:MAG: methylmalonyl Co-A mutase-associated GTPase MeaB [Gammaproteobacteria bacterium]
MTSIARSPRRPRRFLDLENLNRRQLSRALTAASRASPADQLQQGLRHRDPAAYRIGFTGPPGAGKSTLVSKLAASRIGADGRVGVLAIDPTSPISGGAILGDRIRMDEVADSPELYIRSLSSGAVYDGLTANLAGMLDVMDEYQFTEVFIETVGVGQINHAVQVMADTVIVVLVPESGDAIQAMKAGILEIADIYVVNKADRPGAERIRSELESVLAITARGAEVWQPPVIMTSANQGELSNLGDVIDDHRAWARDNVDKNSKRRRLSRYVALNLLEQSLGKIAEQLPGELFDSSLDTVAHEIISRLDL